MKEKKTKKTKKKRKLPRIVGTVVLAAAAVLAVALAVRSQQAGGVRALWRELFGSDGTDEFFFENASGGSVADMDMGLAVAAGSGLYVYDKEGDAVFSRLYSHTNPALSVAGDYGAAYDVGGDTVIFFDKHDVLAELKFENPVVSASVNSLGYLAVCTEEDVYFGAATVYNYEGTAIYRWYSGGARVLSAKVRGREELMVLTVGEGGSSLKLMRLSSEELRAEYECPELMVDAAFTDSGFMAVTGTGLIGLDEGLNEVWRYDFGGAYLTRCRLDGNGAVLGLSDYQVGGRQRIVSLSDAGETLGTLELSESAGDVAMRGDEIAVLTEGTVTVYDRSLEELGRYECDPGAQRAIIREDSTVLCAGSFSAYVYGGDEAKENRS